MAGPAHAQPQGVPPARLHPLCARPPPTPRNAGAGSCTPCPAGKATLLLGGTSEAFCDTDHLPGVTATVREVVSVGTASITIVNGQEEYKDNEVDSDPRTLQVGASHRRNTVTGTARFPNPNPNPT